MLRSAPSDKRTCARTRAVLRSNALLAILYRNCVILGYIADSCMLQFVCAFVLPRDFTCEISKEKEKKIERKWKMQSGDVHVGN